ncbi:MAG: hypothetical protein NVSMB57_00220 [Actinomycetota bacterium]
MQQINLSARPARVVYVPGTKGREAWAIALSSAPERGWHSTDPSGQVLFMHLELGKGWTVFGPPVNAAGKIVNPTLFDVDIAPNGEGWAVGSEGVVVHHSPGGPWVQQTARAASADLHSVSLVGDGNGVAGFAVGDGPTVLRLSNGRWAADSGTALITVDLTAVSTFSTVGAVAVSGNSSQDLSVFRRSSAGWQKVSTNEAVLDGPHPTRVGNNLVVRRASGASVATLSDGTAWIGGVLYVTDAANAFGDDTGRPFVVRVGPDAAGIGSPKSAVTSYCASGYIVSGTNTSEQPICDERFPMAQYDVTSIKTLSPTEIFAGGQGLFHFKDGAWTREPDSNGYLISMAFASPKEGWVASTGQIYGAGGSAYSTLLTIGHWTTNPDRPLIARWPQPNDKTLEAGAQEPNNAGDALAVGVNGAAVRYVKGLVWDTALTSTPLTLHGVAWPQQSSAWAVGDHGVIQHYNGSIWAADPASETLTTHSLFGVAFRDGIGYAVGIGGTILRYDGSSWSVAAGSETLTTNPLFAIASTPSGFVAVGGNATMLEESGGVWHRGQNLARLVSRPRLDPPQLAAIATLTDGSVVIGGSQGALLRRPVQPGSAFAQMDIPIDATIVAVGGEPNALYASISQADAKFTGTRLSAASTTVMLRTPAGWRDLQLTTPHTISVVNDPSAPSDSTYAFALETSGRAGWAVGGTLVNTADEDRHVFAQATSSIYRVDIDGDPTPPSDIVIPKLPEGSSFAFFSESSCGRGMCSIAQGSGNKADVVTERIRQEINFASKLPNGPKFTMFGGNMRATGHPDELREFKAYMRGFRVPFYAAMGPRDLFTGTSATGDALNNVTPSNSTYLSTFADMPGPWGTGSTPSGIKEVPFGTAPSPNQSRTHYAFDAVSSGDSPYRVVVLDSSRKKLDATGQNPAEDQLRSYLPGVLQGAQAAKIPAIVVVNQPSLNPYFLGAGDAATTYTPPTDGLTLNSLLATTGVKAAMSGGFPLNARYAPTGANGVQFIVSGGGGRAMELTKYATDGFYHSWILVTVQGTGPTAKVLMTVFPVVDSISMHSVDGQYVKAGNVLRFRALARFPLGGFTDAGQTRATYMNIPFVPRCAQSGLYADMCTNKDALLPDYQFSTEDPHMARFVKWDYGRDLPFHDAAGQLVTDTQDGYLCTFKAGTTKVYFTMGMERAVRPISIDGGFGPCVDKPVPPIQIDKKKPPVPNPQPNSIVPKKPFFFSGNNSSNSSALFPPIPAPVVAPAPPGAPGVGRKEEHEVQTETEGHGDSDGAFTALELKPHDRSFNASFTAVRRTRTADDSAALAWPLLGGVAGMVCMSAAFAAAMRRRRFSFEKDRRLQ